MGTEFFDDAMTGWEPFFDNSALYLAHFPGQQVTTLEVSADHPVDAETCGRPSAKASAWARRTAR